MSRPGDYEIHSAPNAANVVHVLATFAVTDYGDDAHSDACEEARELSRAEGRVDVVRVCQVGLDGEESYEAGEEIDPWEADDDAAPATTPPAPPATP